MSPYAFIHAYVYKHELFAIDDTKSIWRIWNSPNGPQMQKLFGNEPEFNGPISVLKALSKAYD
jgi:hypothetical protein